MDSFLKSIVNFKEFIIKKWPEQLLWPFFVAYPVGLVSALFLVLLEEFTLLREANLPYFLWLLPVGGLLIGWLYQNYGKEAVGGNIMLFQEAARPKRQVPFVMAPLVFVGTLVTHVFGGSAGREGTAVQLGGAIADAFTPLFRAKGAQRRTLLLSGISAGFAAVFGTPWAGALFALEVVQLGKQRWQFVIPVMIAAFVADATANLLGASHTDYRLFEIPEFSVFLVMGLVAAAILFGLVAIVFVWSTHLFSKLFGLITQPIIRPVVGGVFLVAIFSIPAAQIYMGLGIPVIQESFIVTQLPWVFALKLIFTALTLGSGFKGGEVTPLFFIGATLGSALSFLLPVDTAFLAAVGFVAVFGSASKTPWASAVMGAELFGWAFTPYLIAACWMARWVSGSKGIYTKD
jgi:H+/Cl- antiporter ClcA